MRAYDQRDDADKQKRLIMFIENVASFLQSCHKI